MLLASSPHLVTQPTDEDGTTLLHVAAASSSVPAVLKQLLQHGADINIQDQDGSTALHVAALWGNMQTLGQLLDRGADPFIEDMDDMLPVDLAMSRGEENSEINQLDVAYLNDVTPILSGTFAFACLVSIDS